MVRNRNEALDLYRRALAIKEKCLGPKYPDVATTLNNMAVPRKAQGDRQGAADLYRRALGIFEESLGPTHPKTVACRESYARLTAGRYPFTLRFRRPFGAMAAGLG